MSQRPSLPSVSRIGWWLPAAGLLLSVASCSSDATKKDPVAEAKFENERRISTEDVTSKQQHDAEFMVNTSVVSRMVTQLSELAQKKAVLPAVRAQAATLLRDHAALQQALQGLAQQKSIVLPEDVGPEQQKRYRDLLMYNGGTFDREYAARLTDAYKSLADAFDDLKENAYDGDIRGFAAKYQPTIAEHLTQLKDLEDQTEDLK